MKDEEKAKEIIKGRYSGNSDLMHVSVSTSKDVSESCILEMARYKNEKMGKMKCLADEMYFRMQTLSTDLRPLRKAMEDYHNFIIHEYNE